MHPPLRLAVLVCVLMVLGAAFSPVAAETVKVWKWRDADGRVVYSQHPPAGKAKAEEKHIDPNRNVIESGWPPPAPAVSASEAASSSEERTRRDARGRIAQKGGAAATEEGSVPPSVPPPPITPPPSAVAPPAIVAPPVPPPPPIFPSPGPGGL